MPRVGGGPAGDGEQRAAERAPPGARENAPTPGSTRKKSRATPATGASIHATGVASVHVRRGKAMRSARTRTAAAACPRGPRSHVSRAPRAPFILHNRRSPCRLRGAMVERVVVGALKTNCYIYSSAKKECVIIDPGGDRRGWPRASTC